MDPIRGAHSGRKSKWSAYVRLLPSSFDTPLFFTAGEMELLKSSAIFEDALKMYRHTTRQFVYFFLMLAPVPQETAAGPLDAMLPRDKPAQAPREPLLESTPLTIRNFTFDLYKWAVSAVTTRLNLIPSRLRTQSDGSPVQVRTYGRRDILLLCVARDLNRIVRVLSCVMW